ncbi:MAG: hypothetical protein SFY32_11095 [Bacteroidota bacterium]|nr:hypothetical protein [Bacteroidota bacterium]
MSKAIVTLLIGEKIKKLWKLYCADNWTKYAEKHGYDIIVIDQILDDSQRAKDRTVIWQKCLILEHPKVSQYDRVVWIDADIAINYHTAPCIVSQVPIDSIGGTNAWHSPDAITYDEVWKRTNQYTELHKFPSHGYKSTYYTECGLSAVSDDVIQAGVLVLTTNLHSKLFREVYDTYEKTIDKNATHLIDEMRALSHRIFLKNDYKVYWIDYKFNFLTESFKILNYPQLFPKSFLGRIIKFVLFKLSYIGYVSTSEKAINAAFLQSYFLHFAGNGKEIKFVDTSISSFEDYIKKYNI